MLCGSVLPQEIVSFLLLKENNAKCAVHAVWPGFYGCLFLGTPLVFDHVHHLYIILSLCMCSESAHYMCHTVLWDASSPRVTPVWLTGHCDALTDSLSDCECDVSGWFSNHQDIWSCPQRDWCRGGRGSGSGAPLEVTSLVFISLIATSVCV